MKFKILTIFLIIFIACGNENKKINNSVNNTQLTQNEPKIKDSLGDIKAKVIVKQKVISLKQITKYFKISKAKHTHHKIIEGLNSKVDFANIPVFSGYNMLHAFSYNDYPRKSKPTKYNHFLLYIYEYQDKLKANDIFRELEKIVNKGYLNGTRGATKETDELSYAAYYGGFICLKNNFIIWRVETCIPDYKKTDPVNEYNFLKFLYNDDELATIKFFNSDCGDMFRTYNYFDFINTYSYAIKQKVLNK